jgi:glycosyltransferase involved in cell wall biosynthesis
MRIGYVPYDNSLSAPGDTRRFCAYARKRGLRYELANPNQAYDLVVLSECANLTQWVNYRSGKIVYDLIDSYLSIPFWSVKNALRGSYKYFCGSHSTWQLNYSKSVANLCKVADAVVCTTNEQKKAIEKFCNNTHIILDMHTSALNARKADYKLNGDSIKIAWEGLGINVSQLEGISEALSHLSNFYKIELHIITDPVIPRYLGKFGSISTIEIIKKIYKNSFVHPWVEDTASKIICECDFAVIPIDSARFNRGKPENKLIFLWKMGMPVITTDTPAYVRAMADAGINLTCSNTSEWIEKIKFLVVNEHNRKKFAECGYNYAHYNFSDKVILSKWDCVFRSIGLDF